jgi:hypothetical protein
MKLKIESSDFPPGILSEKDKVIFAEEYRTKLNIDIDISKVALNPGMRFISVITLLINAYIFNFRKYY